MTLDDFCARTYEVFNLDGVHSDYVEVLIRPQLGRLAPDEEPPTAELVNPLIFLTGIRGRQHSAYAMGRTAATPSITCVIGTYGLGKTELMHQLSRHLLQNQAHSLSPRPLPINLAFCNSQVHLLEAAAPPSGEDFAHLLFDHLTQTAEDRAFACGPLLSAIIEGKVFLILDGLDELAVTSQQHRRFFDGLLSLLALATQQEGTTAPRFHIVISMRYEYLAAWGGEGGGELARVLRRNAPCGESLPVYFLRLDLFDSSRVQLYMERRLPESWFQQVSQHKPLLEILYRPLLLRIFCDMASGPEGEELSQELEQAPTKYKNAAQLIDDYVTRAARDPELKRAQETMESSYQWDPAALARKSLDLYLRGINSMCVEDIRAILWPDAKDADHEEVWRSIHKCPFLRRSGDIVVFTHRSFFEFFVAKGVSLDMEKSEEENLKFSAFDRLVLNVDTRKFLKSIVVEKDGDERGWFRRTHRAYGLNDPEEWDPAHPQDLKVLDEERRALLNAMTEPESKEFNERARDLMPGFLARNHDHLHPRYLTYNYEAVGVFLKNNRGLLEVRKLFGELLHDRLEKTVAGLESLPAEKEVLRDPMELLVDTILSIALRLRYSWAPAYKEEPQAQRLEKLIRDEKIRARVLNTLEDISKAVFVTVG